jgi:hypothetical protein
MTTHDWLLDIALDHMTLGRAVLYGALLDGSAFVASRESCSSAHYQLSRITTTSAACPSWKAPKPLCSAAMNNEPRFDPEIASRFGCVRRTVERKLTLIKTLWQGESDL